MKIRFRTDNRHIADYKALGKTYELVAGWASRDEWDRTPQAEPGDTWRVWWHDNDAVDKFGPLAGYDICCIKCRRVHAWTTALNCASRRILRDESGKEIGATCDHGGKGSCWTWSGSAEAGTLTASPSLHSLTDKGGCGYHGFLTNGDIT